SSLWDRRLAMVSTFAFIAAGEFKPTLDLARNYFNDSEDLIAKASGWMLREVGKRDNKVLLEFLNNYAGQMPRIMLRYAIERLPEAKRQKYLNKKRIS
ncbi:DNA alkylation repair protein, partial [Candidatus Falkowbacteria bacterium]|nr:DNA alkylation repair protein [Candidatus Falkowbacteria bacterium]